MKKMALTEFKEKSNIEIIQELIKINKGYVTSKLITELGIHRMYLNIMVDRGLIKKVGNGIYLANDKFLDSYYVLNLNMPSIIYSHITALYFHGFSIKNLNNKYDISIKKNYNNVKLKTHNIFYVPTDI